jgi:hypothetical protein
MRMAQVNFQSEVEKAGKDVMFDLVVLNNNR